MADQQTVMTYLDGYCERAGDPGLWGEPLNAVTNLFFILAAVMLARAIGKTRMVDGWLLAAALFAIGVGSGLWHLHPNGHTVLMDVIPITLFINIYLIAALRRFFGLAWWKVAALWALYTGAGVVAQITLPPDTLNGTIMYIPTYLTLIVLSLAIARRDRGEGRVFLTVLMVWTASLIFRTIDMQICASLSIGTHFLWHTLNAWVLYRLGVALVARASRG